MNNKKFMDEIVYNKNTKNKILFIFTTLGMSGLIFLFYFMFDRLFMYAQVFAEIFLMTIGVSVLGLFYVKKDKYIAKYGKIKAYRKAFYQFHVTTMPFIYMSALHPLYAANDGKIILNIYVRVIIGAYFIISALLLHRKSIKIFGVDNLFMYYVYFPEKSVKTESTIHSILRHPIYSAMARVSIGLGIIMGTTDSILLGFVLPLSQFFWINLFEEKELIARFQESYKNYKKSTPAIWNKPQNIYKFWKFLLCSNNQ